MLILACFGSVVCDSGQVHPGALLGLFPSLWPTLSWLLSHLPGLHSNASLRTEVGRVNKVGLYLQPKRDAGRAGAEGGQELGTLPYMGRSQVTGKSPGPRLWSPIPEFPFQPLHCSCSVAVGSHGPTNSPHSKELPETCRTPPPLLPQCIVRPGKPDLRKQKSESSTFPYTCQALQESPCPPGATSSQVGAGCLLASSVFQQLGPSYPISGRTISRRLVCA